MEDIREALRCLTLKKLNPSDELTDAQINEVIEQVLLEYGRENYLPFDERCRLKSEVFHTIRGFDILEELLEDDAVTEIMVNGYNRIFYEKSGKLFLWEKRFAGEERLYDVIQKMAALANRVVSEASPICDCRLADGSRVCIVMHSVSLDGASVTIRKFAKKAYSLERLTELGALSPEAMEYLIQAVRMRKNIFISGGTGTGKTTFLNALSAYIPSDERVITIEDAAELQIQNIPNLVRLEVRKATAEGCSAVTVRDLIRTALRMRPDRIVVGEVRGAECLDMLQAMNTGHDGSLSTGHSNSARDMIARLETMVLQGSDMPIYAIKQQIASAIDLFVHLSRRKDGSRGVYEICENGRMQEGEIRLIPVFREEEGRLLRVGSL